MLSVALAAISGQSLVHFVVVLLVASIVWLLIDYILKQLTIPEPVQRIVRVVLVVILSLLLIAALMDISGYHTIDWSP